VSQPEREESSRSLKKHFPIVIVSVRWTQGEVGTDVGSQGLGGEVLAGGLSGFPVVGEEVVEAVDRMGADAVEDVAKVGEGIDLESFGRGDEAGQDGSSSPSVIASEEQPVLPSDGNSPQASLGAVVVDLQVSVLGVAHQGFPIRQHI